MTGTFCAYSIMRPMVYHIERYSSEKLFEENGMTFLNATGNEVHGWLEESLITIERF